MVEGSVGDTSLEDASLRQGSLCTTPPAFSMDRGYVLSARAFSPTRTGLEWVTGVLCNYPTSKGLKHPLPHIRGKRCCQSPPGGQTETPHSYAQTTLYPVGCGGYSCTTSVGEGGGGGGRAWCPY